ncbi:MAG: hypothetical protein G3M78_11585 [Candidatus Nitrohelix vancouverensis]|uniref:Rubrerythrin diiron-binding domain-containing protein n=1 Tax=Candidatus Nitrohelix vancouverensis TaxID=2705534 RepID=A0A7T0G427_9BACT|nr:MAG: hypothetical protein G3M78_11585 [Candidatus Nitrohelix vancouverensis]
MNQQDETIGTIKGRLEALNRSLVSERNSEQYYETLLEKTPPDTEENIGMRRMYQDLKEEEKKHVATLETLIKQWEQRMKELSEK